ncbi:MAG: NAD-dependent epimerase/dehydratase family protein [Candidatus Omnitrophota bacterium]|nr:NAD-dependent epimerase/dehydratase family protein [Candidatus Omnitrophota bacterium]
MNLENKNVLVTGGAGVIGRELISRLVSSGANVLCVDREPKPEDMSGRVRYRKADISEMDMSPIEEFDPEIIFHLAASFERTIETPDFWETNFRDNILVSHRIIDTAKDLKNLRKFVFASSYLIYSPDLYLKSAPEGQARQLKEEDPYNTRNLTGGAKYYNENEFNFIHDMYGAFTLLSARIFRVYGKGSRDIVSRWVRMALRGEELVVYNEENIFDYIFAGDVAEGLLRICESSDKSNVINLGTGLPKKVKDVVAAIRKEIPGLKWKYAPDTGDYEASCAETSKLSGITGWIPPTELKDGIKMIVEHEKKFKIKAEHA